MVVVLCQRKLSLRLLNDSGKDYKLTTNSDKVLSFSLGRTIDFVLSLGVITELKTPVMGITFPASFEKLCFDMVKSI